MRSFLKYVPKYIKYTAFRSDCTSLSFFLAKIELLRNTSI